MGFRVLKESTETELAVAAGYAVSPEGYSLAIGDNDRKAWSELLAMLKEGLELGAITGATEITIKDVSGTTRTVTVDRFRQIFFAMGLYYKSFWDQQNS